MNKKNRHNNQHNKIIKNNVIAEIYNLKLFE